MSVQLSGVLTLAGGTCYTAGGMPVAFRQEDFLVTRRKCLCTVEFLQRQGITCMCLQYGGACLTFMLIETRLHQASMQGKRCNDASDTTLIEINGVAQEWVATPFWSDYLFPLFSMKPISLLDWFACSQHG